MEHIVKGCSDCPFRDEIEHTVYGSDDEDDDEWTETQYYCKHPKRYLVNLVDLGNGVITPSDCPLLKEPTTIKLVQE